MCWSLAKLNVGNRKLIDLIYNRILVDIPVMSGKDISYQVWGFAALGYPLPVQVLATYWVSILISALALKGILPVSSECCSVQPYYPYTVYSDTCRFCKLHTLSASYPACSLLPAHKAAVLPTRALQLHPAGQASLVSCMYTLESTTSPVCTLFHALKVLLLSMRCLTWTSTKVW